MAVRTIHETSTTEGEIRRRVRELIEYMQWRGGEQTMAAYDHYFDAARHADIQDQLHERLRVALEEGLKRLPSRSIDASLTSCASPEDDPDLAFLRGLGSPNACMTTLADGSAHWRMSWEVIAPSQVLSRQICMHWLPR